MYNSMTTYNRELRVFNEFSEKTGLIHAVWFYKGWSLHHSLGTKATE